MMGLYRGGIAKRINTFRDILSVEFASARHDWPRAFQITERLAEDVGEYLGSPHLHPLVNLLAALFAARADDRSKALALCTDAHSQLNLRAGGSALNDEEQKYLNYGVKIILLYLAPDTPVGSAEFKLAAKINVQYADLNDRRVRRVIRRWFPISRALGEHWDRYLKTQIWTWHGESGAPLG